MDGLRGYDTQALRRSLIAVVAAWPAVLAGCRACPSDAPPPREPAVEASPAAHAAHDLRPEVAAAEDAPIRVNDVTVQRAASNAYGSGSIDLWVSVDVVRTSTTPRRVAVKARCKSGERVVVASGTLRVSVGDLTRPDSVAVLEGSMFGRVQRELPDACELSFLSLAFDRHGSPVELGTRCWTRAAGVKTHPGRCTPRVDKDAPPPDGRVRIDAMWASSSHSDVRPAFDYLVEVGRAHRVEDRALGVNLQARCLARGKMYVSDSSQSVDTLPFAILPGETVGLPAYLFSGFTPLISGEPHDCEFDLQVAIDDARVAVEDTWCVIHGAPPTRGRCAWSADSVARESGVELVDFLVEKSRTQRGFTVPVLVDATGPFEAGPTTELWASAVCGVGKQQVSDVAKLEGEPPSSIPAGLTGRTGIHLMGDRLDAAPYACSLRLVSRTDAAVVEHGTFCRTHGDVRSGLCPGLVPPPVE